MNSASWMSSVDGKKSISEINIPGTHNSCARYVILPFWTKCQDMDIRSQLDIGVRALDIRLEEKNGRLKLVHAIIDCRSSPMSYKKLYFDEVFGQLKDFLAENPTEAVIFAVARDDGDGRRMSELFFKSFVEPYPDLWFTENRIPRLEECRGKLVLIRRFFAGENMDSDSSGLDATGCFNASAPTGTAPVRFPVISQKTETECFGVLLQDNFNIPPKVKWEQAVLPALKSSRADASTVMMNYLSANNGFNSPKKTANYVNPRFEAYKLTPGEKYGITVFDYVNARLTEKIISSNR